MSEETEDKKYPGESNKSRGKRMRRSVSHGEQSGMLDDVKGADRLRGSNRASKKEKFRRSKSRPKHKGH